MKSYVKPIIIIFLVVIGLFVLQFVIALSRGKSTNSLRAELDEKFFFGKNPGYDDTIRPVIMKTASYQKYRSTTKSDSLIIYLKQAETEAKQQLGVKE